MGGGSDLTSQLANTYDLGDPSLVSCLVSLRRDPEFAELAEAWEFLPTAIETGIVTMVRAPRPNIE